MTAGEKRANPRLTMRSTAIRNGLLVGRVLNMSLGGLAIETATSLRIGGRYEFRVELHDHTLQIKAEIRWCRLISTIGKGNGDVVAIFRAGLSFTRPLALFNEGGLQNNEGWFDPEFHVSR